MLRLFRITTMVAMLGGAGSAFGFSMLGPQEGWQVAGIGYNPLGTDIGGPHNLGEEYRINTRMLYYAFDESLQNYFGTAGTQAVTRAIDILNALPPVSQMTSNLDEFATDTRRVNFQASALGLLDMKSFALGFMVEQMGLTSGERYAWTLRDRRIINIGGVPTTNYLVINRNFDPITLAPTPYVNGVLYTYAVDEFVNPTFADAVERTVDPLAVGFTSVAANQGGLFNGFLNAGEFFTGLTRDDAGGLRYLMHTNNLQVELLLANAILTPLLITNPPPPGSPVGTPFTVTTNFVANQAPRQGIDKVTFVPVSFDSGIGQFITFTNQVVDIYVSNSLVRTQIVRRVITTPDIIFTAEDLGLTTGGSPVLMRRSTTATWANNNGINGLGTLAGPGVIQPQITIAFSKLGPYFFNVNPAFVDEASQGTGFIWGSFDGTTNPPIVFPNGATIQDLENQILTNQVPAGP